VPKTKVNFYFI